MFVLSDAEDAVPADFRVHSGALRRRSRLGGSFPGGFGADLWTFFTYAFLHADLLHIGLNLAWLLPFGTALARRFGAWRYVVFMLVMAAAGALAHLVSHPGAMVPMIGASAAISGAMAAAMRFIFQEAARWKCGGMESATATRYRVPAAPLLATFRDPRFLMFLGVWIGLNRSSAWARFRSARDGPGNRLAGPYRRLSRRLVAVQRLRPGHAAREFDDTRPNG